ncbi:baeRF7 domain-containing protein [Salegentibacter salegens]|uniref:ERF1 domain-containing protein 3 n=1 Tax=Salegentibacter salegens TaxID=143223 RepID=A0A1M7LCH5_9FLAO|nr:hypothetical protein [Salegentibacter salegens]PRX50606.1 hypothetical protein LY58_00764 [Salegentibacter salegens]SHM75718.1 hypothetical protein SAMN05878281_1854 [Salegentibacter salegens]
MSLINEKDLQKLSNQENKTCISIFIPTERAGKDVLEEKNKTHLKSLWKEVGNELKKKDISEEKIQEIGKPIEELINDKSFWRHQSDGLAIFAAEGFFEKYTLPVNFETHTYISNEFYIKPLVPILSGDARFNLLSLQVEEVKLYEATKFSIGTVEIDDLVPSRLEDRVGYDYEEKTLQQKSGASSMGQKNMHGHAGSDRERKDEILRFFHAVDKGLNEYLQKEKLPLVVACQDYLFPIYKEANTYQNFYEEVVPGNPSDTDMFGLHQAALKTLEPFLEKTKKEKMKKFNELNYTDNTGTSVTDILPAIQQGKVDTLFLENRSEIWGTYNNDNMNVSIDDEQTSKNYSLMNWAAKEVLRQGGNVFLIPDAQMPEKQSKMNALYRFN